MVRIECTRLIAASAVIAETTGRCKAAHIRIGAELECPSAAKSKQ